MARFGEAVAPGGVVDRGALAGRAFATDQDRAWLEALLWPLVGARMAAWRSGLERQSPPPRAAVVRSRCCSRPMGHGFDTTIAVVATEPLRAERAGTRGHAALEARSARQLTQQEKAQRATYVIENDGTIADLDAKLSKPWPRVARTMSPTVARASSRTSASRRRSAAIRRRRAVLAIGLLALLGVAVFLPPCRCSARRSTSCTSRSPIRTSSASRPPRNTSIPPSSPPHPRRDEIRSPRLARRGQWA